MTGHFHRRMRAMTIQRFFWVIFALLVLYAWTTDIFYTCGSQAYLYHKYCSSINWALFWTSCGVAVLMSSLLIILIRPAKRLAAWLYIGLLTGLLFTTLTILCWSSFPTGLWYFVSWLLGYYGVYALAYVFYTPSNTEGEKS